MAPAAVALKAALDKVDVKPSPSPSSPTSTPGPTPSLVA